tara:strand:+ start:131 stop:475 length:345 start_codon:yes stop_codon:yes gene_type:complete
MADVIIRPGLGVLQFTGSSNTVAYITASDFIVEFSSSTKLSLKSAEINVSGSFVLTSSAADTLVVRMDTVTGSAEKFKINSQGVTVLGSAGSTPTAVEGGIYYKLGVFYVGDNQ